MSLIVTVKVVPSSGRVACTVVGKDGLKCHLKSPPERGKANEELCVLLAKALRIARECVTIISGQTARKKMVKITADASFDALCTALGIERQIGLFETKKG